MVSSLTLLSLLASLSLSRLSSAAPLEERAPKPVLPAYIAENLGPYSPYRAVGEYPKVPEGCEVTQANILQRHGQRFPTKSAGKRIAASVAKLQNASSLSPDLAFVKDYVYALGADDLTPSGASELYHQGREAYARYSALYPPFTRTDSSQRVVDSVGNWTEGFYERRRVRRLPGAVVIDNAAGSNDTLDDNNCPSAPDLSSYETTYLSLFAAPATARLNAAAAGAGLTVDDTLNLMQLCGFESEYRGEVSPFCGLFEQGEWDGFEYYYDLDKYYGTGYGNPLGPVQGIGYVNELLARLTGNRYWTQHDQTQVNHTLDFSPSTFPLTRSLYYDGTHDNQLTPILAVLGLRNGTVLSATGAADEGEGGEKWKTSEIVPFAGKLVTERVKCTGRNGEFVRFLINDQLQLPSHSFSASSVCPSADPVTGLCPLSDFLNGEAVRYVRENGRGEWQKCGYTPPAE
ncbi:hypothetical protein JCM11251_004006 [Rhodosporidiobolus azoricus]